jgi:hypothetical protein
MRKGREPVGTLIITDDGWIELKQGKSSMENMWR